MVLYTLNRGFRNVVCLGLQALLHEERESMRTLIKIATNTLGFYEALNFLLHHV